MTLWKQGASAVPVLARHRIILGSATPMTIMVARMRRGANSVTSAVPIGQHARPMPMPADPKMIRSRVRTGTADAPCFQRVISLFSLCYLLLKKLSKSLIPLSDCPFVLNRLPVFLGKSPCFREKTDSQAMGLHAASRHFPAD